MVLGNIKQTAKAYLGEKVTYAVVTVPAYFNDGRRYPRRSHHPPYRQRTHHHPIAYDLDKKNSRGADEFHITVEYDLDGETIDVSLLSIDNGVSEVLDRCVIPRPLGKQYLTQQPVLQQPTNLNEEEEADDLVSIGDLEQDGLNELRVPTRAEMGAKACRERGRRSLGRVYVPGPGVRGKRGLQPFA
ncbi:ATPase with role in protein import into the ER [Tulasnella sp. UAMH 9824]|nr:ATPase with role in protein import into the ER [Tulasnella sp. UAMH 9824]